MSDLGFRFIGIRFYGALADGERGQYDGRPSSSGEG